jgi:hypothetical protein
MNLCDTIDTFCNFSLQEKMHFLIRLAHMLTIIARETYEVGGEGVTEPARLRLINEMQHRVTDFLRALVQHDPRRYPDDVLMKIVLEHPDDPDLQQQVQEAVARLIAQMAIPT